MTARVPPAMIKALETTLAFRTSRYLGSTFLLSLIALSLTATAALAALENENLLTTIPSGFKLGFQTKTDREAIAEYVPSEESVENWSRMVTVQIFYSLKNADPNAFAGKLAKQWLTACAGGAAHKATSGVENGYKFALWIYNCPRNPQTGKPENMWLKATSGADSLYSVQYAYRLEMSDALIGPAMEYLRRVIACDTRRADRPCPAGM
jgi:hypothetical protein